MFTKETYIERRRSLASKVESGLLLFLGSSESSMNYPGNTYRFRQDSTFTYFFGLDAPDLAAVIDLDSSDEILFGDDVTLDDIIWMGPQPLIKEKAESVGVSKSLPFSSLKEVITNAVKQGRKVHFLPPFRYKNMILLNDLLGVPFDQMKAKASVEFIKGVVSLRIIKSDIEIAELEKACDLGYAMHYTAMTVAKLGMVEQELVGIMEGVAISGGYMASFPIILSQNGETLHNHTHHQILTDGRLLVMDAGAEIASHYSSDFTRTIPCSGKFTTKQRDIYNIVSAANDLGCNMSRPGITYKEVHLAVARLIAQGLMNLGLMKGDVDAAVAAGAHALFMPHGLGHHMGLDVHDMEDLGENYVGYDENHKRSTQFGLASLRMGKMLETGHVITVEPGIYFIPTLIEKWKSEGINKEFINFDKLKDYYTFGGVRIEDDILITKTGSRFLGKKRLPNTPEAVEEAMKK